MLVSLVTLFSARHGLGGVGVAWLITFGAVAMAVLPRLIRFLRDPQVPVMPDSDVLAHRI
jgi:hypothetical protein